MSCFYSGTTLYDFDRENMYYIVLDNETQIVSRPSYEPDSTVEQTTVTPQEIFYDYDEVMAQMEAERAALEDSDDFEESYYRCSDTDSIDPMETPLSSPPTSVITSIGSKALSIEKGPSNPNPPSSPTPSTPPCPAKRRSSSQKAGKKAVSPPRVRVRGGAQHCRKFNLSEVDLTTPCLQCTYVHLILRQRCRCRNEEPIDWTKTAHFWTHVVQEYRLIQREALVIGEGTLITSPDMYRDLGNRIILCDLCGKIVSRKDALNRHKIWVHKIGREAETGTGTEDGPSSSAS